MTTAFPTALDVFVNPTPGNSLNTPGVLHTDQHANINDAVQAVQARVGVTGSSVAGTITAGLAAKAAQGSLDALATTVAGLSAGSSTPITTIYAASIPFDAWRQMGLHIVTGPIVFTKNLTGSAVGGECDMSLVADGVNAPDFSGFTLAPMGGTAYDNTNGRINEVAFFRTAAGYYYSVLTGAIVDTVAPLEVTATAQNTAPTVVEVLMDSDMDQSIVPPAASCFAVSAGHAAVSTAWGSGARTVNLTVGTAFVNGEAARTLAYTKNGTNNLRDIAGNELANFTSKAITNNIAAVDSTPPTLLSAIVANATPSRIDLTWSESINATVSAVVAFAVSAGHVLTAHTYVDATHSYLTTSAAFVNGEVARTLAYTQPGSNKMQDIAGNLLANITTAAITNNVAAVSWTEVTTPIVTLGNNPATSGVVAVGNDLHMVNATGNDLYFGGYTNVNKEAAGDFYAEAQYSTTNDSALISAVRHNSDDSSRAAIPYGAQLAINGQVSSVVAGAAGAVCYTFPGVSTANRVRLARIGGVWTIGTTLDNGATWTTRFTFNLTTPAPVASATTVNYRFYVVGYSDTEIIRSAAVFGFA